MTGKGTRSQQVIESMKRNKAVYFVVVRGAAAVLARHIKESVVVAYDDLGPEAIYRYYVKDLPAIAAINVCVNNLYESEPKTYAASDS